MYFYPAKNKPALTATCIIIVFFFVCFFNTRNIWLVKPNHMTGQLGPLAIQKYTYGEIVLLLQGEIMLTTVLYFFITRQCETS